MKIFIGADHRGYLLKGEIKSILNELGHEVVDVGSHERERICDYPELSYKVALEVAKNDYARGILICMTGIGHTIAANKVPGAYAALCYNKEAAALSREHNDANILVLGAKFTASEEMKAIVTVWLDTEFAGGRHLRRVRQIKSIERYGTVEGPMESSD
jgi:RpiB/LacA/LacB family sugar-phosphate isomerase